jgi:hypothetical protein
MLVCAVFIRECASVEEILVTMLAVWPLDWTVPAKTTAREKAPIAICVRVIVNTSSHKGKFGGIKKA